MINWRHSVRLVTVGVVTVGASLLAANGAAWSAPMAAISAGPLPKEGEAMTLPPADTRLADLPDGTYQFCSEPDPQDWRVGAGACLDFIKQGNTIEGYYGYPHSSEFVCLKGQVSGDVFHGQGSIVLWAGDAYAEVPQQAFRWGPQGRLSLSQGDIAQRSELRKELAEHPENGSPENGSPENWIVFQEATLNMEGLTAYARPLMAPPAQLCGGQF